MRLAAEFARLEALRILAHDALAHVGLAAQAKSLDLLPSLADPGAVLRWLQAMQCARAKVRLASLTLREQSETELACAHVEASLAILLEQFIALRLEVERLPEMDVWIEPENEVAQ